jgi:hypothetical protein
MDQPDRSSPRVRRVATPATGLGVPCCEAQADGVPCAELGRPCADCERGAQRRPTRPPPLGEPFDWPESFYA